MYKHYVRIDANNNVIDRYSDWEGKYQDGDILVEESEERHYNFPILNERGQYLYRWDNGLIERSSEELFDLTSYKQDKINLLSATCRSEILSDFTSSALGVPHQYGFDSDDQMNLSGSLGAINAGICPPIISWRTNDAGALDHTIDQFKSLFVDGMTHKQTKIYKYGALKDQINDAATDSKEKVDLIVASW